MMKIQSQIIIHVKDRERYTLQQIQLEKTWKNRQAQILKNQQEKERAKAQALENRQKTDKANRNKPKRPTAQLEDNSKNIDMNHTRPQKSKGKASHPDQIKSSKKGKRHLEQVGMLGCQIILHWIQTLMMKIF